MIIDHAELGQIELIPNKRARRIIVRFREGMYRLTHPSAMKISSIQTTLEEMKPRLLLLKSKTPQKQIIDLSWELTTYSFTAKIAESTRTDFYMMMKDNILHLVCPANTNYSDEGIQQRMRNAIEKVLRAEAKRLLPQWVRKMAIENGFTIIDIKINKSKTRWGSCSMRKNINLSYYCLLLPQHLIELIILHELCHTIEMNHGDRFWTLLDKVTKGKSKILTKELKKFKPDF